MKLSIMQPYIFPYLGYFQMANCADRFCFLDDAQFITRGWVNRNQVLMNGKAHLFSIPLSKAGRDKLICEIELAADSKWRGKLCKSFEHAYRKAPFFGDTMALVETVLLDEKTSGIADLCINSIKGVFDLLDLDFEYTRSSLIASDIQSRGSDRILDICKREACDHYINAINGRDLYDVDEFAANNIKLSFIQMDSDISYKQFKEPFVPYLSIIDVLMFNSREETRELLQRYSLV